MKFETLSDYDDEIKKIDRLIDDWEKYFKGHPEEIVGHTNQEILKYIRGELKKEKDKLGENLHFNEEYKMIDKKLLIYYLKTQKRGCNERAVILQKELTSSLMYNHKREYLIKNLMYECIINIIRIYENLIEKIENGEFDIVEKSKKEG